MSRASPRPHAARLRSHRSIPRRRHRAVSVRASTPDVEIIHRSTLHTRLERSLSLVVARDAARELYRIDVVLASDANGAAPSARAVGTLRVHFGLTRESGREWMCPPETPADGTYDEKTGATRVPFDASTLRATIEVPEYVAPASVEFVLYDEATETYDAASGTTGGAFSVPVGVGRGHARELGASVLTRDRGANTGEFNVAILSRHATACALVLQYGENTLEFALNPNSHRTGSVWHVSVPFGGVNDLLHAPTREDDVTYGFRFEGDPEGRGGSRFFPAQVLFDPRAIELRTPLSEMEEPTPTPRYMGSLAAVLERCDAASSGGSSADVWTSSPTSSGRQTVAIDADVSTLTSEGTLAAAVAELKRLRSTMYFNAVALAPIQARSADGRADSPVSFFAIDPRFGSRADLGAFVREMKAISVDVWMRFVLTHTGEGTDASPKSESLRGVDAASYFQLGASGGLEPAGPPLTTALNPCSVPTMALLTDALRTFALHDGIDSFIIETGGGIVRGPLGRSPLLEKLSHDAVVGNAPQRLWLTPSADECGKMPSWGVIGEINAKYARTVERFFRGSPGTLNDMSLSLSGSPDIFRALRDARHGMNVLAPKPKVAGPAPAAMTATPTMDDRVARAELATLFTSVGGVLLDVRLLDSKTLPLARELAAFRVEYQHAFDADVAVGSAQWFDLFTNSAPSFTDPGAPPALACLRRDASGGGRDVWIAYNGTNGDVATNLPTPPPGRAWIHRIDTSTASHVPTPCVSRSHVVPSRSVSVCALE